MARKEMHPDVKKIQDFAERMAERQDKSASQVDPWTPEFAGAKQAATAFWIVRNYIEDTFGMDWSDEDDPYR